MIDRLMGKLRQARDAVQDRSLVRVAPRADHTGRLIIQALDEFVRGAEMSSAIPREQWRETVSGLSGRFRAAAQQGLDMAVA